LLRSFDDTGAGEEVFNVDTGEVEWLFFLVAEAAFVVCIDSS
jgi:hypothetical protein